MERREEIETIFDRLWPILRSITGAGVRQTLDILSELVPYKRIEVPSGTQVYDWTVPKEWVVREAYILTPDCKRILDIQQNNLHLVNYSVPFKGRVTREELDQHLYSLPLQPDAIPYITSYYAPNWGFCLTHRQRQLLPNGEYGVVIDTEHIDGSLTLAEAVLEGEETDEVLFSTYVCHPSMANNELSGPLVTAFLYRRLAMLERRRLTYRFVFLPETIGSLIYLSLCGEHLRKHLRAGYVVTCVGDNGPFTYKRSRMANCLADRVAIHVLCSDTNIKKRIINFSPTGSDERQYCSPGFNLPVGSLTRSRPGTFQEYHTSLDNRDFISFEAMHQSIDVYWRMIQLLEANINYVNTMPFGEPNLGKRGLYPTISTKDRPDEINALKWVLNYSDEQHDLLEIADLSGLNIHLIINAAQRCADAGLLSRCA